FTPTGTPSTGLVGVSNNYLLEGLTAETQYQYYVRQNCTASEDGLSGWAGPFSFYTGYCIPATTSPGSYMINGFSTTNGYTNISNLNNGTSSAYTNYSNLAVSQAEGGEFTYSVDVPAYTNVEIWIDYNQDFVFDPVTEL